MLSSLRRMTGFVSVTENKGTITVSGLPGDFIANDMQKIWSSSRIAKALFTKLTRNEVQFASFFGIEFEYILRRMLTDGSSVRKRTIQNIIDGLHENTWMKGLDAGVQPWLARSHLKEIKFELLPHQKLFLDRYEQVVPRYGLRGMLLTAAAGGGKAQPLHAKIKVPGGWSTMGEMHIGKVVIAPDGTTTKVTGVFPQGIKDIYEITFVDGRKAQACGEHLWEFVDVLDKNLERRNKIVNTKELQWHVHDRYRNRAYFNLIEAEDCLDVNYPVDPYLLGIILGDGSTRHKRVSVSSADDEIIAAVTSAIPDSMHVVYANDGSVDYHLRRAAKGQGNELVTQLRDLGLMEKLSYEKFIPSEYLHGSRAQRLAILQGLMDSDGTVNDHSVVSFCSTSEQLAKDVQYLVRSLGGIARISQRYPGYTYKGEKKDGRIAYNVNIRHKVPSELFRLERKRVRCKDNGQYTENLKLRVFDVKYIGQQEAQCISVDHPKHLYITDDFIITHNTISCVSVALTTQSDVIIMVVPKNSVYRVWEHTLMSEMVVPQNPWVAERDGKIDPTKKWHIFHYETLDRAMELASAVSGKKVCVVLDESHNFNDMKSLRTERFLQVCQTAKANNIIWSSGTPIKALGYEAIPLIKSLDPLFGQVAEESFKKMYGKDAKRALDILKNRMGVLSYIVPKKEFMEDKPIIIPCPITMPNSEKYTLDRLSVLMKAFVAERTKFYDSKRKDYKAYYDSMILVHKRSLTTPQLKKEFDRYIAIVEQFYKQGFDPTADADIAVYANKYEKERIHNTIPAGDRAKFKDAKSVVKYPLLKVRGECLGRILMKERMQCHVDMLPHIDFSQYIDQVEKKTLIFTSYVQVVEALEKKMVADGLKPLTVYGATNGELPATVSKYASNEALNPLIATFQSLSVAVPLIMANGIIMLNSPWRSYEREQAIARCWRIGQDRTVKVFDITLDTGKAPNISTRSIDIMQWSKEQVDSIMGIEGTSSEVSLEGEGYESVHVDISDWLDDASITDVVSTGATLNARHTARW